MIGIAREAHERILEDITRELSGDVSFPTCLDAALRIRDVLKDPFANLDQVTEAIRSEPLICTKLLRLANSVTFNPSGKPITEVSYAISRLGFESVRTLSLVIAMDQMLKSRRNNGAHEDIARGTWLHSVQVAALCRILAQKIGRINPDDALLAGLVHNIGVFYLLYKACGYEAYLTNRDLLIELLTHWHESVGEQLLDILGVPERVVHAIRGHQHLENVETPCTVRDVLYFANLLAGAGYDWLPSDTEGDEADLREADRVRYLDLIEQYRDEIDELRSSLTH